MFLVLAHVGKADALITGDADILAMREDFLGLIMTAEARRRGRHEGNRHGLAQRPWNDHEVANHEDTVTYDHRRSKDSAAGWAVYGAVACARSVGCING